MLPPGADVRDDVTARRTATSLLEPPRLYEPSGGGASSPQQMLVPTILCKPPTPRPIRVSPLVGPHVPRHIFRRQDAVTSSNTCSPASTPGLLSPDVSPEHAKINLNSLSLPQAEKLTLSYLKKPSITHSDNLLSHVTNEKTSKGNVNKIRLVTSSSQDYSTDAHSTSQPMLCRKHLSCDLPEDYLKTKSSSHLVCDTYRSHSNSSNGIAANTAAGALRRKLQGSARAHTVSCSDEY